MHQFQVTYVDQKNRWTYCRLTVGPTDGLTVDEVNLIRLGFSPERVQSGFNDSLAQQ